MTRDLAGFGLLLMLSACVSEDVSEAEVDPFDPALAAELDVALEDAYAASGAPGAVVVVRIPGEPQRYYWTAGMADRETGRKVLRSDWFRLGSITKTLVAAAVHQRTDQGTMDLDSTVSDWVDGYPSWGALTLRQLLGHTSGLTDYTTEGDFLTALDEPWTADDLASVSYDDDLLFPPGTDYAYSNTGYVVLSLVLEGGSHRTWRQVLRSRFLAPYTIDALGLPGDGTQRDITVEGYLGTTEYTEVTDTMHPSAPGAAGEMVGSADGLVDWAIVLFESDALSDAQRQVMLTEQTIDGVPTGHGLGPQITQAVDGQLIGHSGSTMGFQSQLRWHDQRGIVVGTVVNSYTAEADLLDEAVWRVLGALD